ncbi:uncharacterized protein L201_002031 [Kwoniella dendrophila CBS 6074]|uniref:Uncharacterized protein n=1 Tax=Kwoniella dendrophila CBS 6074 TaxID=1295534 RepID=A0AAX4JP23_9TREE
MTSWDRITESIHSLGDTLNSLNPFAESYGNDSDTSDPSSGTKNDTAQSGQTFGSSWQADMRRQREEARKTAEQRWQASKTKSRSVSSINQAAQGRVQHEPERRRSSIEEERSRAQRDSEPTQTRQIHGEYSSNQYSDNQSNGDHNSFSNRGGNTITIGDKYFVNGQQVAPFPVTISTSSNSYGPIYVGTRNGSFQQDRQRYNSGDSNSS